MLTARALGLAVGPMGGFDKIALDAAYFPDGTFKSLRLANLGYGDDTKVFCAIRASVSTKSHAS